MSTSNAQLLGQISVALLMIVLCGIMGIVNALTQIRTGRRDGVLTFVMIVTLFAAIGTATFAAL